MPSPSGQRVLLGRVGFGLVIIVAAVYCVFLIPLGWGLILIPFAWVRKQYRKWVSTVQLLLLGFVGYVVEFMCRIRIVITGGEDMLHVLPSKPMIISNRQGELDWLFLLCISLRLHRLAVLKITTWEEYIHIPFLGWLIQVFLFPTVCGRDKVRDLATLRNSVEYLSSVGGGCSMVLFPEGASISETGAVEKSHRYADVLGFPHLSHVLIPRAPGIHEAVRSLNRLNAIDSIIDITMGYLNCENFSTTRWGCPLTSFWDGTYPREVHVHMHQVRWVDIPPDIDSMRTWVIERFLIKEKMLNKFYQPLTLVGDPVDEDNRIDAETTPMDQLSTTSTHVSNLATFLCFHEDNGDSPEPCEETFSKDMRFIQYVSNSYVISAVVALMVNILVALIAIAYPQKILLYFLFVCLTYSVVTRWLGGFHILESELLGVGTDYVANEYYPVDLDLTQKSTWQMIKEVFVTPKGELESGQKDKDSYIRAMRSRRVSHRQKA
jgi:1-acyl-sn-glycerol-3-phosphate acyltransferase